jgi:Response regulator containing CheY-like receiver, AAA-type ATPase, and DNA-binding domains
MEKKKILVVDDDEYIRESIKETLKRKGFELESAENGKSALELFQKDCFDMVISDMKMPGMSGIELLEKIKQLDPYVPFLMITAHGALESAVESIKKGACDYIQKSPNLLEELELKVEMSLSIGQILNENKRLKSVIHEQWNYVGSCASLEEIRGLVKTVAASRSTILITGESGTGKELVARSIHYLSPRHHGPFVKVNCAALPEGLIESELFGHEKGAFTGALNRKLGKFELASGGTLLLDEIGEMSFNVQAKLLRVLQEREINKVGGDDPVEIDIRIVATTNRDLDSEVKDGKFREDLFYRLNVFRIHLPPLRERKEDMDQLVEHLIKKYNEQNGFGVEGVEAGCIPLLKSFDWPGNVRELENFIERAVVLTRSGKIKKEMFVLPGRSGTISKNKFEFSPGITIGKAEKELILRTLDHCNQNRTKAAQLLGISIRTLRNKLNEYGMEKE